MITPKMIQTYNPLRRNHGELVKEITVARITVKSKDISSLLLPPIPKKRKEEKNWGRESQDHWLSCPQPNFVFS